MDRGKVYRRGVGGDVVRLKHGVFRRSPCNRPPAAPMTLTAEFFKRPGGGRHNRWRMRIKWAEVRTDIDGLPVLIREYKVRVEYTTNGIDWFILDRITVPGKVDEDENDLVSKVVKGVRPTKLAYRFTVTAFEVNGCASVASLSDEFTLSHGPPAPENVSIHRRPHGIFLDWDDSTEQTDPDSDSETPDPDIFDERIDHYVAQLFVGADTDYAFPEWVAFTGEESDDKLTATAHGMANGTVLMLKGGSLPTPLKIGRRYYVVNSATNDFKLAATSGGSAINLTADGSGDFLEGLYVWKRHLKKTQFRFHVDDDVLDEDQKFYGRVLSADDDRDKSVFIPATLGGNDDPDAAPDGRVPKNLREKPTFTIPVGMAITADTVYGPPDRADDDYRVRRVTGTTHVVASGGATTFDVQVKTSTTWDSMFDDTEADMLTFSADNDDASTKAMTIKTLARGDKYRVKCISAAGTPPDGVTINLVLDRMG
jgi:hypothetical protein